MAAVGLLLVFVAAQSGRAADFSPSPSPPGRFPLPENFTGEFRFGWSGIEAGRALARLEAGNEEVKVTVDGGTIGWVRTLWKLDVSHRCSFAVAGLRARSFEQLEKYAHRTLRTQAQFEEAGVRRLRQSIPGPPARWKRVRLPGLRDVVSAMFFIRSQELAKGEVVRLPVFPGDSPFLVEVTSQGRCEIAGRPALRLDLRLRRIVFQKGQPPRLEPHRKFRRASVWISDDAYRLPLRTEVEVFIGKIYGELQDVRWQNGDWYLGRGFE